jgi:hypothetical protein
MGFRNFRKRTCMRSRKTAVEAPRDDQVKTVASHGAKRVRLAAAALLATFAICAPYVAGALDFKGVVMGAPATNESITALLGPLVFSNSDQHTTRLEGITVFTKVTLDADNRVEGLDVEFQPYEFPVLEAAAIRKWGKPAAASTMAMQNGFGAQVRNRIREWHRDGFTVTLYEYDLDGKGWMSIARPTVAKPVADADRM